MKLRSVLNAALMSAALLLGSASTALSAPPFIPPTEPPEKPIPIFLIFNGVETEALAWSWGTSRPLEVDGSTRRRGDSIFQDVSVTRLIDSQSPVFLSNSVKGVILPEATLASGDLILTMTNVLVTSFAVGGSGNEDSQTENITLDFEKFSYNVGGVEFCWNIEDGIEECPQQ
jgi:hypothetical protein